MLVAWAQLAPTAAALQGQRLLPTTLLPLLESSCRAATGLAGTTHRGSVQGPSTAPQLNSSYASSNNSNSSSDTAADSATSGSSQPYDVCIVGAGMVGAALAALLQEGEEDTTVLLCPPGPILWFNAIIDVPSSQHSQACPLYHCPAGAGPLTASMRIALVDQQRPPMTLEQPEFPDLRVSTITPANMLLLQQAGAWQELAPYAPTFQHMQVWEFAGPGFVSWQAGDVGLSHMGCVVENRLLQAALLRAAVKGSSSSSSSSGDCDGGVEDCGCLDLICPASVQEIHIPDLNPTNSSSSSSQQPTIQALGQQQDSSSSSSKLAELRLADGRALQSRLLVAADGSRSKLRDLAGFRTVGWSYNQRGLVATVATSQPNDTAWQRFLPTGPIALLPVRGGYSNIVWTVTPEMARQLESCCSSEFAAAVNDALQQHPDTAAAAAAGGFTGTSPGPAVTAQYVLQGLAGALSKAPGLVTMLADPFRAAGAAAPEAGQTTYWRAPPLVKGWVGSSPKSFPLQLQHSGRYAAPRVALVGDAAHAIHPLAGQGVNLGLADAAALAEALAHARRVGSDIGDVGMLQNRYEVRQQRANIQMMTALELLWQGFRVEQGFVGAVRSTGLGVLNNLGPLKNNIMKYAMGLSSVPGS